MMTRLAVLAAAAVLGATPLAAADRQAEVTSLSVDQAASAVELNIQTRGGTVEWADFTLENPARLVVDLRNARSALTRSQFDGIRSAGVLGVRSSQYEPGVVRVVVDLDRARSYSIDRNGSGVRISIEGAAGRSPGAGRAASRRRRPRRRSWLPRLVAVQEPRISVRFEQADIRDVLATFAEFANRSIVPGSGVSGSVTAEIRNQPWDVAMETILRAYGLAAQELPSGIIRVDAMERLREREELDPLVTQTFRINYVPVAEIQTTLQPLLSARGRISISPSTNTLIITDVETVIDNVRMMANQLDIRTPQVAIQAKIAYIERTEARRLGFSYDFRTRDGFDSGIDDSRRVRLRGDLISRFGDANFPGDDAAPGATGGFSTAIRLLEGRVSLTAFIEALEESRLVDVQAHPLVTTLDNQEAEILVGQRIPIRVVDVGGPGTVGGARATVQIEEAGTRLVVTPTITPDRRILLQLAAERSGIAPDPGDIGVIIDTQEGRTRMLVENGETAVLGGLTETQVNQVRSGIPYLMNIPGIGALFRTTATEERKRDLLILVTPRIIEERN
jgi:type IV pilus assembly protein PilQ